MKTELTAADVAGIIYQTIEEQPRINPATLIPTITAVIRAFSKANNVVLIEKKEEGRKHAANMATMKMIYWQRKVKEIDPVNIEKYYQDITELENNYKKENGIV